MEPKSKCRDIDRRLNNLYLHLALSIRNQIIFAYGLLSRGEEVTVLNRPSSWDGLPCGEQLSDYFS